jgi:hypothetical protein
MASTDKRCCGSGVCIINADGECWCGQVWDGEKMAPPSLTAQSPASPKPEQDSTDMGSKA